MLLKKPALAVIAASLIAAFSGTAAIAADEPTGSTPTGAETTTSTSTATTASAPTSAKLVSTYTAFAGSDANAKSLVDGLRNGKSITLSSGTESSTSTSTTSGTTGTATASGSGATTSGGSVTFTPATQKMGNGNVNIALALAQAELTRLGITEPTPEQIEAALNGGSITGANGATDVPGVLQLRSEGQGWGLIAKTLGFKLGDVMSASKTDKNSAAMERRANATTGKSVDRLERAEAKRNEKVERVAKVDRPVKVDRPMKVERPEKVERPMKVERPERAERPQR